MNSISASVTNTSNILSIVTTANHDSPIASATVEAYTTTLALGDPVTISMGYNGSNTTILTGYVKQIDRNIPNNTYSITIYDNLIRAQDYFIASTNPNAPLSYQNILAETLISNLMGLAGLTMAAVSPSTSFYFGINNPFEINLVSVFDYSRTIADLLTWSFWCDASGVIQFKNRKPYVMLDQYPENVQPGFSADTATGYTLVPTKDTQVSYTKSERNLRNRVVVYGAEGIYASASASSPYLPAGFYKSAVFASSQLVDNSSLAQDIADYNLNLFNRLTEQYTATLEGNPALQARTVIALNDTNLGLTGNWYVYGCDHSITMEGYSTTVDLRRSLFE